MSSTPFSRRSFLAMSAVLPWAFRSAAAARSIPVGLELYSVRQALKQDPEGTVRAVAKMGYRAVEFYAPYFEWTDAQAKQMRKVLDQLGVRCYSTHNDADYFSPNNINRARDLNLILGSEFVVSGLETGYHNHQAEFTGAVGQRPIDLLAKSTKPSVMLQLDVGTCLEAGSDPVAWIRANPGRIRSIHCKDWSPDAGKGYKVLFGEGAADWKGIFQAAENGGGLEYYLIEQEGSQFPEMETASKCFEAFRAAHRER